MASIGKMIALLAMIALGLVLVLFPATVATIGEMIDAIGRKRRLSEVEPAGWRVSLTRVMGAGPAFLGFMGLAGSI